MHGRWAGVIARLDDHDQRLRQIEIISAGIPRIEAKMDKLLESKEKTNLPGRLDTMSYRVDQLEKNLNSLIAQSNGLAEKIAKWSVPVSILIALIAAGAFVAFGVDPTAVKMAGAPHTIPTP